MGQNSCWRSISGYFGFRHAICTPIQLSRLGHTHLYVKPRVVVGAFYSVTRNNKKIVMFLAAVALGSGALAVRSTLSTTTESTSEESKFETSSLFAGDPNLFGQKDNLGTGDLVSRTMIAVLVVVALGVSAIYFSKKLLPRITNLPGREIRISETVRLGPHNTVHLVKIGNQHLLIGSTNENITMLANVTDALSETDLSAEERGPILGNIDGR